MRKTVVTAISSVFILFLLVGGVYAVQHEGRMPTNVPPTQAEGGGEGQSTQGRERACENIENSVRTRNRKMLALGEVIMEKFGNISIRVQEFYETQRLPEGHEVENYDELLEAITEKESEVETALAEATAAAESFDCDLSDPKTSLMSFKDEMLDVVSALREYRIALKDLIVAVMTSAAENGVNAENGSNAENAGNAGNGE